MPRARCEKSIEAEKRYHAGEKLVDIAHSLEIPEGTVRRWKSDQGWGAAVRKRGAPKGSKNAMGNSGGAAPLRNKNAEVHGIYSAVFWDTLTDQEREIADSVSEDVRLHLFDEVRLLAVRERRLMGILNGLDTGDLLLRANAELTRVQAQKLRALALLDQICVDRERLDLDLLRIELAQQAPSEDTGPTSNLIEAMGAVAGDVWGDQ